MWSGVWWSLGAVLHVNFLALGSPLFGNPRLALGRQALLWRTVRQCVPVLIPLAVHEGVLVGTSRAPGAAERQQIFLTIRGPWRYVPNTYLREYLPLVGWHLVAVALLARLPITGAAARRWASGTGSMAVLVVGATLLMTLVCVEVVVQLFFWRPRPWPLTDPRLLLSLALCAHIALAFLALRLPRFLLGHRTRGIRAVVVLLVPLACWRAGQCASDVVESSTLLPGGRIAHADLYAWSRTMRSDARFLVPPDLGGFRHFAGRTVVGDWKSTPILPSGLREWCRRIEDVSGVPDVPSLEAASCGYAAISLSRLEAQREMYDLAFAVLPRADAGRGLRELPTPYKDATYRVVRLRPEFVP